MRRVRHRVHRRRADRDLLQQTVLITSKLGQEVTGIRGPHARRVGGDRPNMHRVRDYLQQPALKRHDMQPTVQASIPTRGQVD